MTQKSILFDLDGTLTDSGEGIMKSAVYALAHYGIDAPSEAELRTFVGPPLTESFARFGVPKDQLEKAVEIRCAGGSCHGGRGSLPQSVYSHRPV